MAATSLKVIVETSRAIIETTSSISTDNSTQSRKRAHPFPIPTLSPPPTILANLLSRKFPPDLAQEISERYHAIAMKLHMSTQAGIHRLVHGYPETPGESWDATKASIDKIARVMQHQYEQKMAHMLSVSIERACAQLDALQNSRKISETQEAPRQNRSFNQEYTPLLEKYFEYNPYPSGPDRALLARKSMMTLRQIEVWFQNHRNRARKEGKTIFRRSPDELPAQIPLESLGENMPVLITPAHERMSRCENSSPMTDSEDGDDVTNPFSPPKQLDSISTFAPPHAFPTAYEESKKYTTFISKSSHFSCSPITWTRKPTPPSKKRKASIDMDGLCNDFMGTLSLCGGPMSKKSKRGTNSTPAWFAYRQTIPAPAPHPALIYPLLPAAPLFIPAVRNSATRSVYQRAFQSPPPNAPMATLVPPRGDVRGSRKTARLPKRTPNHSSITHHGISPTIPDTTSPSFISHMSPVNSRTSSFSSSTSSRRRLSSSSCSSTTSSTLTTPVMMPTELPEMRAPSVTTDYSHNNDYQDLFGDLGCEASPPIQRHMSFSPGPKKLPFDCDFASSPYAQTPSP